MTTEASISEEHTILSTEIGLTEIQDGITDKLKPLIGCLFISLYRSVGLLAQLV